MYWLALGKPQNWVSAFDTNGTWGLKESQISLWERLDTGDTVYFYVTSPVSGIIGNGTISTKFRQDRPLWPEEISRKEVIWPLRFQFDVLNQIPHSDWIDKKTAIGDMSLSLRSGFQELSGKTSAEISRRMTGIQVSSLVESDQTTGHTTTMKQPDHNKTRDILVEMGRMQGFSAEKEYPMDSFRLDAVWKRIYSGVPTYVFEVQVGGSIEAAMSKLKHAYDKWNSNLYIIIENRNDKKLDTLLSGTFHEIRKQVNVIRLSEIDNLYMLKRNFKDKEKEFGLIG